MHACGWDPNDLDERLEARMEAEGRDPSNWLTDEEVAAWKDGEGLVDLLDEDERRDILRTDDEEETDR